MMVRLLPEKTINPSRGRLSHVWARPAILASLMGLALAGVSLFASDRVQGTIALAIVGIGIGLLLELVLRQDWAAHRLDSISQLLNTIDQLPPDLVLATQKRLKTYAEAARMAERQTTFEQALSDRMDGLQEWLEHVTHGRLRVDLGTSALLTDSFSECSTVNAVTRATASLEWWSSEAGDRYWEANVSALRSGVTINRIYVGDSSLSTAQQACLMRFLRRELKERTALGRGGEVFYVEAAELRAKAIKLPDMVIFDEDLLHEILDSEAGQPVEFWYKIDKADITRGLNQFKVARAQLTSLQLDSPLFKKLSSTPALISETSVSSPEFLRAVFQTGMPPAFVKQVPQHGPVHILESDALKRYEPFSVYRSENADYQLGDSEAMPDKISRRIELAASSPQGKPRIILTTKTGFLFEGEQFVVGWYVPIQASDAMGAPGVTLADDALEVVHGLMPVPKLTGISVSISPIVQKLFEGR